MIQDYHLLTKIVYHYYLLGHQNLNTCMIITMTMTITTTFTAVVYSHQQQHLQNNGGENQKTPLVQQRKKHKLCSNIWTNLVSQPAWQKLACIKTTKEILFVLHNSVADSSAWRRPRLYRTQQDPSSINYKSTACQWDSNKLPLWTISARNEAMQYRAHSSAKDITRIST